MTRQLLYNLNSISSVVVIRPVWLTIKDFWVRFARKIAILEKCATLPQWKAVLSIFILRHDNSWAESGVPNISISHYSLWTLRWISNEINVICLKMPQYVLQWEKSSPIIFYKMWPASVIQSISASDQVWVINHMQEINILTLCVLHWVLHCIHDNYGTCFCVLMCWYF